jgi:ABC-type uncharacterized transport system permease subunit
MQRDAAVPATLVSVIEALLILAVVAIQAIRLRRRSMAPPLPAGVHAVPT